MEFQNKLQNIGEIILLLLELSANFRLSKQPKR